MVVKVWLVDLSGFMTLPATLRVCLGGLGFGFRVPKPSWGLQLALETAECGREGHGGLAVGAVRREVPKSGWE